MSVVLSDDSLASEIASVANRINYEETEDSWNAIGQAIQHLTHLVNTYAARTPDIFIDSIRSLSRSLTRSMNSERTALSGDTLDLLSCSAINLGPLFEPLVACFFPSLLALCARPSKLVISRARACLFNIVQQTYSPIILRALRESMTSKSVTLRQVAAEVTLECLNNFSPREFFKDAQARELEAIIRVAVRDASADVRKTSRALVSAYGTLMPDKVEGLIAPLSPTSRKYLSLNQTTSAPSRPPSAPPATSSHWSRDPPQTLRTNVAPLSRSTSHREHVGGPSSIHAKRQRTKTDMPPPIDMPPSLLSQRARSPLLTTPSQQATLDTYSASRNVQVPALVASSRREMAHPNEVNKPIGPARVVSASTAKVTMPLRFQPSAQAVAGVTAARRVIVERPVPKEILGTQTNAVASASSVSAAKLLLDPTSDLSPMDAHPPTSEALPDHKTDVLLEAKPDSEALTKETSKSLLAEQTTTEKVLAPSRPTSALGHPRKLRSATSTTELKPTAAPPKTHMEPTAQDPLLKHRSMETSSSTSNVRPTIRTGTTRGTVTTRSQAKALNVPEKPESKASSTLSRKPSTRLKPSVPQPSGAPVATKATGAPRDLSAPTQAQLSRQKAKEADTKAGMSSVPKAAPKMVDRSNNKGSAGMTRPAIAPVTVKGLSTAVRGVKRRGTSSTRVPAKRARKPEEVPLPPSRGVSPQMYDRAEEDRTVPATPNLESMPRGPDHSEGFSSKGTTLVKTVEESNVMDNHEKDSATTAQVVTTPVNDSRTAERTSPTDVSEKTKQNSALVDGIPSTEENTAITQREAKAEAPLLVAELSASDELAAVTEPQFPSLTISQGLFTGSGSTETPAAPRSLKTVPGTPISSLLLSIQHGFAFSPIAPMSPAQSYNTNPHNLPATRGLFSIRQGQMEVSQTMASNSSTKPAHQQPDSVIPNTLSNEKES